MRAPVHVGKSLAAKVRAAVAFGRLFPKTQQPDVSKLQDRLAFEASYAKAKVAR